MDILEIMLLLEKGSGENPEILMYKSLNGNVVLSLSKEFRSLRYAVNFEIPVNLNAFLETEACETIVNYNVRKLQKFIDDKL